MKDRSASARATARMPHRLARVRGHGLPWVVVALLSWGLAAPPVCGDPGRAPCALASQHSCCTGRADVAHGSHLEGCGCADLAVVVRGDVPPAPVIAFARAATWGADPVRALPHRMSEFATRAFRPSMNPPLLI